MTTLCLKLNILLKKRYSICVQLYYQKLLSRDKNANYFLGKFSLVMKLLDNSITS